MIMIMTMIMIMIKIKIKIKNNNEVFVGTFKILKCIYKGKPKPTGRIT